MTLDTALERALREQTPLVWINPQWAPGIPAAGPAPSQLVEAESRMGRAGELLADLFAGAASSHQGIESPLQCADALASCHPLLFKDSGPLFLKRDDMLPVAGSIKARGGFHEVLALAERIAQQQGLRTDPGHLLGAEARALFSRYTVAVGSTGNLGMSIGIFAAALGFRPVIHMSVDAKQWKKQRLRDHGARVVEHTGDYASAVEAGRREAGADPLSHFVDDERSMMLFLGYAASARHVVQQLRDAGRSIDAGHPLFVYLPCGVGGAPGGIAYGLKQLLGDNVHCFFIEPVASPCMLVQLASGSDQPISVHALGLDNRTEADGLAVGLASPLVAPLMRTLLSGVMTIADDDLFRCLFTAQQQLAATLEPSAAAALSGPGSLLASEAGRRYIDALAVAPSDITHLMWSTGGSMVPAHEYAAFLARGRALLDSEPGWFWRASSDAAADGRLP
ncbi:D-serine ammonia-lyase [Stenotrophomonas maltophilia]